MLIGRRSSAGKVFTLTEKGIALQRERRNSNGSSLLQELLGVPLGGFESFRPKRNTVSQLVDLEEEMAKDGFDYSVFVPKEVVRVWRYN